MDYFLEMMRKGVEYLTFYTMHSYHTFSLSILILSLYLFFPLYLFFSGSPTFFFRSFPLFSITLFLSLSLLLTHFSLYILYVSFSLSLLSLSLLFPCVQYVLLIFDIKYKKSWGMILHVCLESNIFFCLCVCIRFFSFTALDKFTPRGIHCTGLVHTPRSPLHWTSSHHAESTALD